MSLYSPLLFFFCSPLKPSDPSIIVVRPIHPINFHTRAFLPHSTTPFSSCSSFSLCTNNEIKLVQLTTHLRSHWEFERVKTPPVYHLDIIGRVNKLME